MCRNICTYQKNVVPLQRIGGKHTTKYGGKFIKYGKQET